jgi:hypothetical protein
MTYLDFRLRIARNLIEEHHVPCPLYSGGKKSTTPSTLHLKGRHFVTHIPPTQKKSMLVTDVLCARARASERKYVKCV